MTLTHINHINPGMMISSAIEDDFGRIIFKENEVLTENAIFALKNQGFYALDVSFNTSTTENNEQLLNFESEQKEFDKNLDQIFRNHETDPLMMKFKQMTFEIMHDYFTEKCICSK